jgi:DNA ligase-4
MKGEYIDALGDSLDLIVIGGYFGERKRIGGSDWTDHISVFLCGVIKKVDMVYPTNSVVLPFARVGTGYSMEEL